MLNELRRFDADTADLTEMVALLHLARGIQAEFAQLNLPVEEWIDDVVRRLQRAISSKTADQRELRLKEIRAARASLKTAAEKRQELEAEEAALLAQS